MLEECEIEANVSISKRRKIEEREFALYFSSSLKIHIKIHSSSFLLLLCLYKPLIDILHRTSHRTIRTLITIERERECENENEVFICVCVIHH